MFIVRCYNAVCCTLAVFAVIRQLPTVAAAYELIVYTDPAQPQLNEPIRLLCKSTLPSLQATVRQPRCSYSWTFPASVTEILQDCTSRHRPGCDDVMTVVDDGSGSRLIVGRMAPDNEGVYTCNLVCEGKVVMATSIGVMTMETMAMRTHRANLQLAAGLTVGLIGSLLICTAFRFLYVNRRELVAVRNRIVQVQGRRVNSDTVDLRTNRSKIDLVAHIQLDDVDDDVTACSGSQTTTDDVARPPTPPSKAYRPVQVADNVDELSTTNKAARSRRGSLPIGPWSPTYPPPEYCEAVCDASELQWGGTVVSRRNSIGLQTLTGGVGSRLSGRR